MQIEGAEDAHDEHMHPGHHDHDHTGAPATGLTGLALIGGFLAMLLLDQLQAAAAAADGGRHPHHHHHHHHHLGAHADWSDDGELGNPLSNVKTTTAAATVVESGDDDDDDDGDDDGVKKYRPTSRSHSQSTIIPSSLPSDPLHPSLINNSSSTPPTKTPGKQPPLPSSSSSSSSSAADRAVVGLLVHCASDGLAMGAAFLSGSSSLSVVVGTAMVLHKAPMAFGLTSYLQGCRWPWVKAQRTLTIFSATAPVVSLVTYTLLSAVPAFTTPLAVSLAILFSGGTFMYASCMHILPEIMAANTSGHFNGEQLIAVGFGCFLPVLLSWGHHH